MAQGSLFFSSAMCAGSSRGFLAQRRRIGPGLDHVLSVCGRVVCRCRRLTAVLMQVSTLSDNPMLHKAARCSLKIHIILFAYADEAGRASSDAGPGCLSFSICRHSLSVSRETCVHGLQVSYHLLYRRHYRYRFAVGRPYCATNSALQAHYPLLHRKAGHAWRVGTTIDIGLDTRRSQHRLDVVRRFYFHVTLIDKQKIHPSPHMMLQVKCLHVTCG